jgi:hypothetical protein
MPACYTSPQIMDGGQLTALRICQRPACSNCRRAKSRCTKDPPCERCARKNIRCAFTNTEIENRDTETDGDDCKNSSGAVERTELGSSIFLRQQSGTSIAPSSLGWAILIEDQDGWGPGRIVAKLNSPAHQPKASNVVLPEGVVFRGMAYIQIDSTYASFIDDNGCLYFVLHPDNESIPHNHGPLSPLDSRVSVFILPWMVEHLLQNYFQCSHLERANLLIAVSQLCDIELKRFSAATWRSPSVPLSYSAAIRWYHWILSSNQGLVAVRVDLYGWHDPKGTHQVDGYFLFGGLQGDGSLAATFCYVGPNQSTQSIDLKFESFEALGLQGITLLNGRFTTSDHPTMGSDESLLCPDHV